MRKTTLSASLALAALCASPATAQISLVNPVPHTVTRAAADAELLPAPDSWKLKGDEHTLKGYAAQALAADEAPVQVQEKAKYTLTIGVRGDKAVKSVEKLIPQTPDGYYLKIDKKSAVIAGNDATGLYYGVQTLLASLAEGQMELCTVTDWPDVPFRGTVEGFYGTPWSHEARLSQIDFYGRHKMNVYIYGPKDDPYHRDHWREPYPEKEAARIQQLDQHARERGVRFYWAIHPGVDIKWNDSDRDKLVAKFERMYTLGIRSFAVFFDDIWGEGTRADKQAELLNYVDDNFVKKHGDVSPLIMCPTEYNRSWANDAKGYLRTLGTKLNKSIQIMWTGNSVVHCIDKESMEWINQRIDRKAYIWWNFPVSDFVRDRILLGPAYGNGLDIAGDMSGFVSNPMEHAEASKLALYGIADYTWNMKAYDYKADWERAIRELLPDNADALRTFALYNKDLGQNGHGFRREEGEELKPLVKALADAEYGGAPVDSIEEKCDALEESCKTLLSDQGGSNPALIRELRPWLLQGVNVAHYGKAVCAMARQASTPEAHAAGSGDFVAGYDKARAIQQEMYELENSDVRHALQPGIKLATKELLPALNKIFAVTVDRYNAANGTSLSNTAEYSPYKLTSDVKQLALLPVSVRGNDVSVAPSNEVIQWQKGGSLEIAGDREITLAGMDFNLGVPGVASSFKLEVYSGGTWKEVSLLHYKDNDPVIHTGNELGGMQAEKLRVTNVSGKDLQVYFRHFKFVKR